MLSEHLTLDGEKDPPSPQGWAPEDKYLWDFWTVEKDGQHHMFYLQAPRDISHPEMRHGMATVGHAVSDDLVNWEEIGTALEPGQKGSWDDTSIWTGSVIEKDGTYFMFYTSRSSEENGLVQRVGLATSDDLVNWEKQSGPVMEADARWYEKLGDPGAETESWRDPQVVYDPSDGFYHAYVCARTNEGPLDSRGCIAHARSKDLYDWEVLAPISAPGNFSQMEVPVMHKHGDKYHLFFATDERSYSSTHENEIEGAPQTGVFMYVSDRPDGGFRPAGDEVVMGSDTNAYTCRIVQGKDGRDRLLTWLFEAEGRDGFAGVIDTPYIVNYEDDGSIELEREVY